MNFFSLFVTGEDHTQRCAKIDRGQSTRVAMMEHIGPIRDQCRAVVADRPIDLHIFIGQRFGLGQHGTAHVVYVG